MAKFSPKEYDAWYKTPLGSLCDKLEKEAVFALFVDRFKICPQLVLDVGCGTGNYTLELARQGIKVISIDSSFEMAAFAKRKADKEGLKSNFVVGRAEAMPFKGNIFDGVLSITTLCFVSNAGMAVDGIKRVVRPEGSVVLGELNKWSYWAVLRKIKALFKESSYRGAKFFSFKSLKRLLKKRGFKDLKWSACLYFPPINSEKLLRRWRFFENMGKRLFPKYGAFIVISGVKQGGKDE